MFQEIYVTSGMNSLRSFHAVPALIIGLKGLSDHVSFAPLPYVKPNNELSISDHNLLRSFVNKVELTGNVTYDA